MSIEAVRDYWDNRPCNIYHSNAPIGTQAYFDEVERKKDAAEPHIAAFADFERWRGKDVLEIGCGIGTATVQFARAGARVDAIDLSEVSTELCCRRLTIYGLHAGIFTGNAEELDRHLVPLKKYDLIYSFGVIHHSPNPRKIIEQMAERVKPGGEIRIMVYSLVSYKLFELMSGNAGPDRRAPWDMAKIRESMQMYSEAQVGSPCTHLFTFDEIEELLSPWFSVQKMWKAHIFIWDIERYKRGEFVRAPAWKDVSRADLRRLEKELGWHTMVIATPTGAK